MKSFDQLIRTMSRLRSPKGCPWDREQTHESLLKYLFEEAGEFRQSVRKKDYANMEEELGDILLQVIFHAELGREKGRFSIDDVVKTLIRKLTLRHPHVFGYRAEHRKALAGRPMATSRDILDNWDILKRLSSKKRK